VRPAASTHFTLKLLVNPNADYGRDAFLRNVGSYKSHTALHRSPRLEILRSYRKRKLLELFAAVQGAYKRFTDLEGPKKQVLFQAMRLAVPVMLTAVHCASEVPCDGCLR
jgi:hypothetical protein